MKGFLNNLFSAQKRIASDFLTTDIAYPHAKIRFYSSQDKRKAIEYLSEALEKILDIAEYQKLPWFGKNSQKAVARQIGAAFFRHRLKSFDFPLQYYCYYIDEVYGEKYYCDYFYVQVNPELNSKMAILKFENFISVFLRENFPQLCRRIHLESVESSVRSF